MRTTITFGRTAAAAAITMAMSTSMIGVSAVSADGHTTTLDPATTVITDPGHYVPAPGATYDTVDIAADNVTLEGFDFVGGGTTGVAIKNTAAGLENISILDSSFSGYTARPITFGFAEGTSNAAERASNFVISGNTISDIAGLSATAIVVFDTDGVTITNNTIDHTNTDFLGRRGINLDSNSNVKVTGNTVALGATGSIGSPSFSVFFASPWAIQVSQSNAAAVGYDISANTLSGSYDGVTVLSKGDVDGFKISGNNISAAFGVRINSGALTTAKVTFSDVRISGNRIDASAYTSGVRNGVRIQNNAPLTLVDSAVVGNSVFGANVAVFIDPAVTQVGVKVQGNRLR